MEISPPFLMVLTDLRRFWHKFFITVPILWRETATPRAVAEGDRTLKDDRSAVRKDVVVLVGCQKGMLRHDKEYIIMNDIWLAEELMRMAQSTGDIG